MLGKKVSHYQIHELLGAGGMGEVYKAWDEALERWVALKFLPGRRAGSQEARERFRREAQAAAALDHPAICAVHEIGESNDGQRFICMALCEGESLDRRLAAGHLAVEEAVAIARQIAAGLDCAHRHGILHRDLKPANVIVGAEGQVKIVDFGLAKLAAADELTRTRATLGTVAYMSPEQVRGEELDARSDLFSLGVVLFEMLAGRRPFEGASAWAVETAITGQPAPPLGTVRPGVPPGLAAIVEGLLVKERNDRMGSARDVEAALAVFAAGDAGELPTAAYLPASGRRRWRTSAWKLLAAATALIAALALWLWRAEPPRPSFERLAILPFENFTGSDERAHLGPGLAAGLISALSEVSGLAVVSRSEAWHRTADRGSIDWARKLGAGSLLEGTISLADGQLAVAAELVAVSDGSIVWSDEIRGAESDLIELQKTLAARLTEVLRIPMSARERQRLARDPTRSFQAYDLYLQATRDFEQHGDLAGASSAAELFRQALRLDPEFALAYCGLSQAEWWIGTHANDAAALERAEGAARRALEVDPELPAAQIALARVMRSTGRVEDSIADLEAALAGHPNPQEAQRELARSYEAAGDLVAAEAAFRSATIVAPGNWYNWSELGDFYHRTGSLPEARAALERAVALAPAGAGRPREQLGSLEISAGRFEAALGAFEQIGAEIRSAALASNIGTAYYFSDRPDKWSEAERYYRLAVSLSPRNDQIRRNLADLHLQLGRPDEALAEYRAALALVEESLAMNPADHELRLRRAFYAARAGDCARALASIAELRPALPPTARNAQRSAYVYALCGEASAALDELGRAVRLGMSRQLLAGEDEFASLRQDPRFVELVRAP